MRETMNPTEAEAAGADPRLPAPVRERWKIVIERATANAAAIQERIGPERQAVIAAYMDHIVKSTDPTWIRLRALNRLADEHMAFTQGNVACRRGCSHCCHCAVAVAKPEAEMIGMAIKRPPKKVSGVVKMDASGNFEGFDWGYHNPCSFLKNGECSIYEHRPLACRVHYNLDNDDLLCQLNPPLGQPVPWLDATAYKKAYMHICGPKPKLADIREYFPKPTGADRT